MESHAKDKQAGKIVPATPKSRNIPNYPLKCLSGGHDFSKPIAVTLTFNVDRSGKTDDIRIASSDNACFNEAAVNIASTWLYEPRTVNGRKQKQYDLETTLKFVVEKDEETPKASINDYDAQPLKRIPPRYPDTCLRNAEATEFVVIEFDVDEAGNTQDPRVISSTSRCFNNAAINSVKDWQYTPRTVNGVPTLRPNVITRINFQFTTPSDIRRHILNRANRIGRLIKRNKMELAYEKIKETLDDETLNLSAKERALILQMRAGYRLDQKDYTGALDDLRFVRDHGLINRKTRVAITETIAALEKGLGITEGGRPAPTRSSDNTTDTDESSSSNGTTNPDERQ